MAYGVCLFPRGSEPVWSDPLALGFSCGGGLFASLVNLANLFP